ncbi:hypothetical protein G7046_g2448 [Stylonectria norvegica]|nr:hypothetical protein G7046_g2448 [Stylonectria norvegica]
MGVMSVTNVAGAGQNAGGDAVGANEGDAKDESRQQRRNARPVIRREQTRRWVAVVQYSSAWMGACKEMTGREGSCMRLDPQPACQRRGITQRRSAARVTLVLLRQGSGPPGELKPKIVRGVTGVFPFGWAGVVDSWGEAVGYVLALLGVGVGWWI